MKSKHSDASDYFIEDELSWMLKTHTKKQIRQIMESVTPEINTKNFKIKIIYGR